MKDVAQPACQDVSKLSPKKISACHPPAESPENSLGVVSNTRDFILDSAQPLDPRSFPHPPRSGSTVIPATIPNLDHLLRSYEVSARYDVIKKKLRITVPGVVGSPDNSDNVAMANIISLANLHSIPTGQIPSFVQAIGDRHLFNPAAAWITGKSWDGVDRLPSFYGTLVVREGYSEPLKQILIYKWLLSAVAAALKPSGFRARGVLTLQGPQSIGKTAWVAALIPDIGLRERLIQLDHVLDANNKDSILTAICHWIVEIGELDSSFRRDPGRLKGFLTNDCDKVRRPYGHTDSEYPRRTVFCATVNDNEFLVDLTGNTRWWTLPVEKVDYDHRINTQQLFAQIALDFEKGAHWWLTQAEERCLEENNKRHHNVSVIRELILAAVDLDRIKDLANPLMTAIELLQTIGIDKPTNPQCKECNAIMREIFGDSKRIRGQNKWRIPLKQISMTPIRNDDDF
jgi:putative DNA primase/helicase